MHNAQLQDKDAPTLADAMRVTHRALRAWYQRLRDRAELKAHLGMMEIDQRLGDLEPEITRLGQRTAAETRAVAEDVRKELSRISRELEKIDQATKPERE